MNQNTIATLNIIAPTVHMNGSSPDHLAEAYAEAHNAIRIALERLAAASPNARDYYVQPGDAFGRASAEHRTRVQRIESVRAEIEALAENVMDQKDERARARR